LHTNLPGLGNGWTSAEESASGPNAPVISRTPDQPRSSDVSPRLRRRQIGPRPQAPRGQFSASWARSCLWSVRSRRPALPSMQRVRRAMMGLPFSASTSACPSSTPRTRLANAGIARIVRFVTVWSSVPSGHVQARTQRRLVRCRSGVRQQGHRFGPDAARATLASPLSWSSRSPTAVAACPWG
jgi:hypothetical protein